MLAPRDNAISSLSAIEIAKYVLTSYQLGLRLALLASYLLQPAATGHLMPGYQQEAAHKLDG
jgi:hypothetical protein